MSYVIRNHNIDCCCPSCRLLRVIYAVEVGKNKGDLLPSDYEWAVMVLAYATTMEELDEQSTT